MGVECSNMCAIFTMQTPITVLLPCSFLSLFFVLRRAGDLQSFTSTQSNITDMLPCLTVPALIFLIDRFIRFLLFWIRSESVRIWFEEGAVYKSWRIRTRSSQTPSTLLSRELRLNINTFIRPITLYPIQQYGHSFQSISNLSFQFIIMFFWIFAPRCANCYL
jgi:hypothetical protein